MPGVQMPHWAAPCATKACWSADSLPPAGKSLDGHHLPAGALAGGDDAGADLLAVEQHRAGAAVAGMAADLGAGQAEFVAQQVRQAPARIECDLQRLAVHAQRDGDAFLDRLVHLWQLCNTTRRTSSAAASMRYSRVARMSSIGARP